MNDIHGICVKAYMKLRRARIPAGTSQRVAADSFSIDLSAEYEVIPTETHSINTLPDKECSDNIYAEIDNMPSRVLTLIELVTEVQDIERHTTRVKAEYEVWTSASFYLTESKDNL